ncbi:hypothetical protein [Bradyrhizobium sp. JYMT SZCCT0428]|uniref:hypothetical protein n=1 Tax=Bradyrhizobium sp. JYMT SZCCT0428 TaxID=2807673 RepID=UPI001BA8FDCB|nr:hypothetical protein [Bradyrhizobium sp. JYMT SZCCT0428]MBR1153584.1 hypothetical protein [Bradyrhizobium sp. JYMT SZCCT0428]
MAKSVIKTVVAAFTGSEALPLGSEMPETPGLKLTVGKISTATRKSFVANGAALKER